MSYPTVHKSKLAEPHYTNVKSGAKPYETRVFDVKRRKVQLGDIIEFAHNNDPKKPAIRVRVVELALFKNFRDAITSIGVRKVLPNVRTTDEGVKLYESFPGYKENAKIHGVVRWKLELLK